MGDLIWPPLDSCLRESLVLFRYGDLLLKAVQAYNDKTREVIQLLQLSLNEGDLDPQQEERLEVTLAQFEADLIVNSLTQESLLQRMRCQRDNLFDWVLNSPLVQSPRVAIHCRTTQDINAVHTMSLLGNWPQPPHVLFKVAINEREHANNPVQHPQYLAGYALTLNLRVFIFGQ